MLLSGRGYLSNGLVLLALALGGLAIDFAGAMIVSPAYADTRNSEPEVAYSRFEPVVIFNDGRDEMTLEARVTGSVAKVEARQRYSDGMIQVDGQDMELGQRFELFHVEDDIYARDGITSEHSPQRARVDIIVTDENGEEHNLFGRVDNWFIVTDKRSERRIFDVSDNMRMTTNLVNIRADEEIFDIQTSTEETDPPDLEKLGQAFYEHFPDDFDFMTVFVTTSTGAFHFYVDSKNTIEGIGKAIFDNTEAFGSDGRLQGVAYLNTSSGGPINHELTHNFGVFLDPALGLDDGTPHWGGVDIPGTLGGLDFEPEGNGQYRITWSPFDVESDFRPMAPMELYLWGLVPAGEVPDATVLHEIDPAEQDVGDIVSPDGVTTVTMNDIHSIHGPRLPAHSTTSGEFRMASVVVSSGRWASDAEMSFWSSVVDKYGAAEGASTVLDSFGPDLEEGDERPRPTASFDFWTQGHGEMDVVFDGESHDLAGLTGAWFDPATSGQGFNLQMASGGLFGYYYGYDDQGRDLWLLIDTHDEPIEFGQPFSVEVFSPDSGVFGDPGGVASWGEVTLRFDSCESGHAHLTNHSGDMVQDFELEPLALVDGADRENCRVSVNEGNSLVDLNAAWFEPRTSGQGWNLVRTAAGLFGYFYGYTASGDPLWLITEEVIGDIELDQPAEYTLLTNQSDGASFEFPTASTDLEPWGEATMTFDDCRSGTAQMEGIDGTQVQDIEVLASTLTLPECE